MEELLINLNTLQRSIKRLETQSNGSGYGRTVAAGPWSVSITMFNARNRGLPLSDLDAVTRDFEGAFSLIDDICYMRKALGKANSMTGLNMILLDLDRNEKRKSMLASLKSAGMLTRDEAVGAIAGDSTTLADFSMSVTDYSSERFDKMREENAKEAAQLLAKRDILNAETKVDVSELSVFSRKLLGF